MQSVRPCPGCGRNVAEKLKVCQMCGAAMPEAPAAPAATPVPPAATPPPAAAAPAARPAVAAVAAGSPPDAGAAPSGRSTSRLKADALFPPAEAKVQGEPTTCTCCQKKVPADATSCKACGWVGTTGLRRCTRCDRILRAEASYRCEGCGQALSAAVRAVLTEHERAELARREGFSFRLLAGILVLAILVPVGLVAAPRLGLGRGSGSNGGTPIAAPNKDLEKAAKGLRSSDTQARVAAVEELARLALTLHAEVIPPLDQALRDRSQPDAVRIGAAKALARIGAAARGALVAGLKDPRPATRQWCALGLTRALPVPDDAVTALTDAVAEPAICVIPTEQLHAAVLICGRAAIPALQGLRDSMDPEVRTAAASLVNQIIAQGN